MILILGAGFIGSSLQHYLTEMGMAVRLFSRNLPTDKAKNHFRGDIVEIEKHAEIFDGVSTVIHTIHTTVPANSFENEVYDVESNVCSTIKLLKICAEKKVENFVYLSSGGTVYGNSENPCAENSPTNPISSYGITKLACEKYVSLYQNVFSGKCVILRPSNIYGESQKSAKPQGLIKYLINAIKTRQKFQVWGDGNGKKDYLHIDDFLRAISQIINYEGRMERTIFNVGSGKTYSINEIIGYFEKAFRSKIEVEYAAAKVFDVQNVRLDSTLFKTTFAWESRVTMEDFVRELYGKS